MKPDNNPKDFVPGDDVCKSCTGIVYYTQAMRKNGEIPVCFGKKSTLTKRIPLDKIEELDKKTSKTDLKTYICIGYSQTSGRMERTGKLPVCINGVQFHFLSSTTEGNSPRNGTKNNNNDRGLGVGNAQDLQSPTVSGSNGEKLDDGEKSSTSPRSITQPGSEEVMLALTGFKALMQKGVTKQYNGMVQFYTKTADKFPEKVHRSYTSLLESTAKTFERVERGMVKLWSWTK